MSYSSSQCSTRPPTRQNSFGNMSALELPELELTEEDTDSVSVKYGQSRFEPTSFGAPTPVWFQVDLEDMSRREFEHQKSWDIEECKDQEKMKRQLIMQYEKTAAMYRELAVTHKDLHPLLSYGAEGKTFVVVHQGAPHAHTLRTLGFTPHLCFRILFQTFTALNKLHKQGIFHGHLTPDSFIIEVDAMGPRTALAWTPGQRRSDAMPATLGFRGPGAIGLAADVWSVACVVLVWWKEFEVLHPWTQFAKAHRPQQKITEALKEDPPQLPNAYLDLHLTIAQAEEPEHTFFQMLQSLLAECLMINDPSKCQTVEQLLKHKFFQQSL